jgi:hypothetical protein
MENNEQPEAIDVDAMSDEELDSFLEEHTGLDADAMNNSDVVDQPDTPSDEIEEGTPPQEEEEGEDDGLQEEEIDNTEEEVAEEEEVEETPEEKTPTVSLDGYAPEELTTMTEVYEDLFKKGIKASGVERTVRDAEHLKTLVRIGLSANENNRKIKPYLKQLRSLEQAGVSLADDDLNFLVDVMKGDKDAVKELVRHRLQLGEEELQSWYDEGNDDSTYVPKDHVISDSRFQLEEILNEIKPTETYSKTVDFITTIDDDGKVLISEHPELVKLLNDDMENGIFQKALDEAHFRMDRGLLPKQSILQSYIQVMQDEEFYKGLVQPEVQVTENKPVKKPRSNKDVVNRKKRASTVGTSQGVAKSNSQHSHNKDINRMSDEEFEEYYATLGIDD